MQVNDRVKGRGMRDSDIGTIIEIKGKMALVLFDRYPDPIWKPFKKLDLLGQNLFDLSAL